MTEIVFRAANSSDTIAVCRFDETIKNEFSVLEPKLSSQEINDIKNFKNEIFRWQKMAGRILLNNLLGESGRVEYNQHGKPILKSHPFDISFSHAKNMVAVMLSKKTAGIDIQDIRPKINRIVEKFMNKPELDSLSEENYDEHATIYWCAKEALYKAYGEKQLIFTDNIIVQPFTVPTQNQMINGSIVLNNSATDYKMKYELFDMYSLVYLWNE